MMKIHDLEVTHRTADVGDITLHYVTRVEPREDAGEAPTVLLLHGFPEMWWTWRYQIRALADAGFRVVAPDLRGYNETDKRGPFDLDTLAQDVRALVASLGVEKVILVGHDWGGGLAWHVAATMPELVEKLVVLNCPHPARMLRALTSGDLGQLRRSWYMFFFQLPWLPERMLTRRAGAGLCRMYRAMAVDRSNFSDEELGPFVDNILRPGAPSAMIGWYRAAFKQALVTRGHGPKYPVISAPTLLVWAKDDKALGYDALVPGTERYVTDLRIEPIERCGHFVQAERPDEVNRALLAFIGPARRS